LRTTVPLSLDLLETFATLIQHEGDAGDAARALKINQPSMSKRLANLQHSNGLLKRPWLRRVGKKWYPTDEGNLVLPIVHDLLRRYYNLHDFTNARPPAPTAVLRFACGQTAGSFLVRRALQAFYKHHANARVRVSTMRAPQRIAGLVSGAIDMVLIGRESKEIEDMARGTRLHIEPLMHSGYCLACAHGSPWTARFNKLSRKKPASLSVLAEFPLIVPEPDSHTRQVLDALLNHQPLGGKVEYRIEIGGWLTILDCVRARLGVGLVSEMAAADPAARNLIFRPISDSRLGGQTLKLVTRKSDYEEKPSPKSAMLQAWRESLKASLDK
jgi:DNA-binding transcriptional LysR family regulator